MANRGRWAQIGPKFGALNSFHAMVAWETQATACARQWSAGMCRRCYLRSAWGAPNFAPQPRTACRGQTTSVTMRKLIHRGRGVRIGTPRAQALAFGLGDGLVRHFFWGINVVYGPHLSGGEGVGGVLVGEGTFGVATPRTTKAAKTPKV